MANCDKIDDVPKMSMKFFQIWDDVSLEDQVFEGMGRIYQVSAQRIHRLIHVYNVSVKLANQSVQIVIIFLND